MPTEFSVDLSAFAGILDRAETATRTALDKNLITMADDARLAAPVGKKSSGRTSLANSIMRGPVEGSLGANDLHGELVASAPHAEAQEFGSGKHGPRGAPYDIKPRFKRWLRFPVGGSIAGGGDGYAFAKAVKHPGVRPKRFLQGAVERGLDQLTSDLTEAIAHSVK